MSTVLAMGWHRYLSLESLVHHRATLSAFVASHAIAAYALYIAVYIGTAALSLPGAIFLTIAGGILFGGLAGGMATIVGATVGATIIFLVASSAFGEILVRRAGPLLTRLADGFRENAFSYLLLLRLVPLFPFWVVNLAPALCGVPLSTFVFATALGIVPGTFAYAFLGAGLDSAIASQEAAYNACMAAGRADCKLDFDLKAAVTPQLVAGLTALALVALVPIIVKWIRTRRQG
ncbi:MAG: TVP38/TMEM64 family protein [Rhizobiales bacterium]|nr:TVP38/TMEM64 family protein [Hyphomicrobiales bacterium]